MRAERSTNAQPDERHRRANELRRADDDALLSWARTGNDDAFAELYRRHRDDALRYADGLTLRYRDPDAAEDLLAEAIRKILTALDAGAGPVTNFRLYLFISVRSAALGRARDRHRAPTVEHLSYVDDRTQDIVDRIAAAEALQSLSPRWRQILWATSVDQLTPAELATVLGMRPNSVAVLAHRARSAYRDAYRNSA